MKISYAYSCDRNVMKEEEIRLGLNILKTSGDRRSVTSEHQ